MPTLDDDKSYTKGITNLRQECKKIIKELSKTSNDDNWYYTLDAEIASKLVGRWKHKLQKIQKIKINKESDNPKPLFDSLLQTTRILIEHDKRKGYYPESISRQDILKISNHLATLHLRHCDVFLNKIDKISSKTPKEWHSDKVSLQEMITRTEKWANDIENYCKESNIQFQEHRDHSLFSFRLKSFTSAKDERCYKHFRENARCLRHDILKLKKILESKDSNSLPDSVEDIDLKQETTDKINEYHKNGFCTIITSEDNHDNFKNQGNSKSDNNQSQNEDNPKQDNQNQINKEERQEDQTLEKRQFQNKNQNQPQQDNNEPESSGDKKEIEGSINNLGNKENKIINNEHKKDTKNELAKKYLHEIYSEVLNDVEGGNNPPNVPEPREEESIDYDAIETLFQQVEDLGITPPGNRGVSAIPDQDPIPKQNPGSGDTLTPSNFHQTFTGGNTGFGTNHDTINVVGSSDDSSDSSVGFIASGVATIVVGIALVLAM